MVQDEQRHLHALDLAELSLRRRGQLFGFIIAIAFLAVAGFLVSGNHEIAGTVIGSVDLVALTTVFVVGQRAQSSELEPSRSDATDRLIKELQKKSKKTSRERRKIEEAHPARDLATIESSSGKETPQSTPSKDDSNDDAGRQDKFNVDASIENVKAAADDPGSLPRAPKPALTEEDKAIYRRLQQQSDNKGNQQSPT